MTLKFCVILIDPLKRETKNHIVASDKKKILLTTIEMLGFLNLQYHHPILDLTKKQNKTARKVILKRSQCFPNQCI